MTQLADHPDLLEVARRVVWFEPPEKALADVARFVAYAVTWGDHADMKAVRRVLDDDALRAALDRAPPGIIDERSWAYWNLMLGRFPAPPMPERQLSQDESGTTRGVRNG